MDWILNKMFKHKIAIIVTFLVVAVICVFMAKTVTVNYNMMDYLPEEAPSTVALDVMDKEYSKAPPNARVMLENVSIPETLEYKERLTKVDGIEDIRWLDDLVNIEIPLETIEKKTVEAWYVDNKALFTMTIATDKKETALDEVRKIIGDNGVMSGEVVNTTVATQSTSMFFSLLSVIGLLPVLALLSYKLIDKTHHKSFMPSFKGFSKVVTKIRVPVMIIFCLLLIQSYFAPKSNHFTYGSSGIYGDESTQVGRETALINKTFGKLNQMVLMVPKGNLASEKALSDELKSIHEVSSVISYVDTVGIEVPIEFVPSDILSDLVSEHYSRMIITVNTFVEDEKSFSTVDEIRNIANKYYPSIYHLTGESVNTKDMKDVTTADDTKVNGIAVGAIAIILILTFRSISIPVILLIVIEASIWINLSFPYFSGETLFFIAYLIISSVQLGATVDYAILFTNRYIENREILNKSQAAARTISDTTVSIITKNSLLKSLRMKILYFRWKL